MAIRKRKGASGIGYQVYWKNPFTGKQQCQTFCSLAEARKHDSLIKHKLKFEQEDFRPAETVRDGADRTLEDAVFLFLREKRFTEIATIKFLSALRRLLEIAGHTRLTDITSDTWNELVRTVRRFPKERGTGMVSDAYVHGILKKVRTVLRWSHEMGMLDALPRLPLPAANYARTVPPTTEEVRALLHVAPKHLKRVIMLGMFLGLRVGVSEIFALRWRNVDLARGVVLIDTSRKNKNAPWREVPLRQELLPIFSEWFSEDDAAGVEYVVSYKGRPVKSVQYAWRSALKKAGIARRVRPYDLRHAFASHLIEQGVDVGTVSRLMGHASPQMLYQHYQYVSTTQKKEAVEKLPTIW